MPAQSIEIIDTLQFGLPQSGALYVLSGSEHALIESGTARSIPRTLDALQARSKTQSVSPKYVFLTHIHLDHAGGAGHLARAFPATKIVVHERGLRHLVDPQQLLEGVRMAAPETFPLYGNPLPVPENQLIAVTGGEIFGIGDDIQVEVIATPGHAPHHVCYFEQATRTLFTGDAIGNWGTAVDVPLTVPPRFDLCRAQETLRTLRNLNPDRLAFTHFGWTDHAMGHIARYERELEIWFGDIRHLMRSLEPEDIVKQVLKRPAYGRLPIIEQQLIAMCVRGAIMSLQAGSA